MAGRLPISIDVLRLCKHRHDRPHDEPNPSHVLHPNGSAIASFDRTFISAAIPAVLDLRSRERA
jgi:hypothetical protein